MGIRERKCGRLIAVVVVSCMIGCVFLTMLPTASSADASAITVLRENFENPNFNCDTGWDQDGREMWVRGDSNANSGVDTWCHSKYRVSPLGNTYSLWCAVIGTNSIAGGQSNTGSQRYDANMSAYIRHSLSMSPELGDGTLTFIYWSKTMASSAPGGYDHLRVSVSADNSTYTTIWTQPSADEASWRQAITTVPSSTRTISFDFISGPYSGAVWQEGAYIDNILVTQVSDPSWSFVKTLPTFSPGNFRVDVAVDTSQGIPESIRLYCQAHSGGSYELYRDNDHQDGSFPYGEPIMIDSVLIGGEGNYSFYSVASGGGVTEPRPSTPDASTSVDTTLPTSSATASGTKGGMGYYVGPVTVQIAAEDQRSGVKVVQYDLDDGGWMTSDGQLVIDQDGEHLLSYRAVDGAGNIGPEGTLGIHIDRTAPTTAYGLDGSSRVGLLATDGASGVSVTHYRLDGGEWQEYASPIDALGGGHETLEYFSTDAAGNNESIMVLNLHDVPMSRVALALDGVKTAYSQGETVSLSWKCTDPSGLVDRFEILVDGVVVMTLDNTARSFDLTGVADGERSITVRAVGDGGNSTFRTIAVTIGPASIEQSDLFLPAILAVAAVGGMGGFLFAWSRRKSK